MNVSARPLVWLCLIPRINLFPTGCLSTYFSKLVNDVWSVCVIYRGKMSIFTYIARYLLKYHNPVLNGLCHFIPLGWISDEFIPDLCTSSSCNMAAILSRGRLVNTHYNIHSNIYTTPHETYPLISRDHIGSMLYISHILGPYFILMV